MIRGGRPRASAGSDSPDVKKRRPGAGVVGAGWFSCPSGGNKPKARNSKVKVVAAESTLPVWALDRVDVYRGGAPVVLGGGGIGGLVHLVPRRGEHEGFELAGGVGSFGLYEGRGSASVRSGELSLLAAAGVTVESAPA